MLIFPTADGENTILPPNMATRKKRIVTHECEIPDLQNLALSA
ncbi:Uncharacterised protein [Yersinia enterocolitica subsp. enterocolitica]|nr:Uncharacterised protein [Yersinia enterocolitica subsp. enterocolitica]